MRYAARVSIVLSVLLLAVLILLHEAGHFGVARACGMRVTRFSIGFGPVLTSFRPKGSETTYQIAAVPLGGFVQIAGMDPHEPLEPGDTRSYAARPLWQRAAVVFAGPAANYLVAAVLFAALYAIGFPRAETGTVIGEVTAGKPAARAGLEPGDRVLSIDGRTVRRWDEIAASTHASPGKTITFEVRRGERTLELRARPARDPRSGLGIVGIAPAIRLDRRPGLGAIPAGFHQAGHDAVALVRSLTTLALDSLMGPVGIVALASDQVQRGVRAILLLGGGLSVALSVMNFLPLPALDGGRLVFLGYEMVLRRRVRPRFEALVHWVGLILLLALLAVITFRDILVAARS